VLRVLRTGHAAYTLSANEGLRVPENRVENF
jgi:hypothetical protein